MPAAREQKDESESSSEDELEKLPCIAWSGVSKRIPVLLFCAEAIVSKDVAIRSVGEKYNLAFKIVRTESRLVRGILVNHGFHEVHPNSNDFNLMWTGSHLKPYLMRSLHDFQKVNHFPRSYELTRKDRLYKNIQRMQQTHGFQNFHIVPQTFVLPAEYQEFSSSFSKDKAAWIIKPVASSRGRGIYLVSSPSQIPLDENILVSRYISNPLLIDGFKFDMRLYVLVTSYDPLLIYLYEEGLARFATVKYDHATSNIKNQFMHLTNYSVNKKSSDYVSCDDPEVEDYGNKWSMSAMLRYLRQEGKDTTLLMGQIEDLIIKALLSAELHIATACKMFVPHRCNCFELYGFDVLIDSNLKPWLLEVNLSPSLACDAPLDLKIKASMISDMFSLVGFVCQDPLLRQPRPDRAGIDSRMKNPSQKLQRQRPPSANTADPDAQKEKPGTKLAESTLSLTAEEMKVLRRVQEEYDRRGGFVRIFPTPDTWELYSGYLEYKTSMNAMLANKLFHGRTVISRSRNRVNDNISLVVGTFYTHHAVQYERKLLSLEVRKQKRKPRRVSGGRRRTGLKASRSPHMSENEDGVEGETEMKSLRLHTNTALEQPSHPKVNLLHILQQGWDLSKVQARMAFSSYLHRVQLRLLTESRANTGPAWTQKEHDQMELVVRFLKRASSNLRQDMCLEEPSPQLRLSDRQRILSHQLGNFIQLYNQETKQMVESLDKIPDKDRCINPSVFQEFILEASENDLEEVLTFYTQKNKSASVFLGTKCDSSRVKRTGDENREAAACMNTDASNGSDNTDAVRKTQDTDSSASQTGNQDHSQLTQSAETCSAANKTKCNSSQNGHIQRKSQSGDGTVIEVLPNPSTAAETESRASQDGDKTRDGNKTHTSAVRNKRAVWRSGSDQPNDAALECEHIVVQHCLPPPYVQPPPHPLASSSSVCVRWASARSESPAPAAARETPRPVHACSFAPRAIQTSARPSSAGNVSQKPSLSKSRPGSAGLLKETDSLSAQAQSNQLAIVSALRKLVEKQAARQYSTSSHISLLTQHLTNLNLTNGLLSRGGLTLSPGVRHGPVRAVHTDTTARNSGLRVPCEAESLCDVDLLGPQKPPPGAGNYQLQFAIQQLQQQKQRSRQLLDQSRTRHQAILSAHTLSPAASARPLTQPFRRTFNQPGHAGLLTLAPKPPSSAPRETRVRKIVTHTLHKKALSEPPAGQSSTSGQHVVYEAVCAKTGLSMYSKLFHAHGSRNR
ncbi:tubulin polyglutamylase TTLL5 isoform X2 [Puntigrus tetrazona]|uniref:tubulin polyglutamylase TTLL5 isoform X2 n=1 Tax=Puntigrus tetrazona TaxID=1606681 RepID=UPI001C8AD095|nr:tubulin polyglutamylase TTLL5 isoform X2 [Puntigrus tetrazona]